LDTVLELCHYWCSITLLVINARGFEGLRDFVDMDIGFDILFRKWVNKGNPSNTPGV
jgi:hypothetical protein